MEVKEGLEFSDAMNLVFDCQYSRDIEEITLNGIDNATDLFWFCVKVLKYGIVKICHNEESEFDLDKVSKEQLDIVKQCMLRLNIVTHLSIISNDETNIKDSNSTNITMSHYVADNDKSRLENHILVLFTSSNRYVIGFQLIDTEFSSN